MNNDSELNNLSDKYILEMKNDKLMFYRTLESQIKLYDNSFKTLINNLSEMINLFQDSFSEIIISRLFINNNKWNYSKVNNINIIQEQLKNILYSEEYEGVFCFAFNLCNSKTSDNIPELKILMNFTEYKYYIGSRISNSLKLPEVDIKTTADKHNSLIANYYHQQLSKEDIDIICSEIENDLIKYIQSRE